MGRIRRLMVLDSGYFCGNRQSAGVHGGHSAHSQQPGLVIVRVDERRQVRIVGTVYVSPARTVTGDEDTIPAGVGVLPGKHWLKIEMARTLTIGE